MYTTLDYYKTTYGGRTAADAVLTTMLNRAADDIDIATLNRVDTSTMSDADLLLLSKANCAQAEFYIMNGTTETGGGSASLGSFSYSGSAESPANPGGLCGRASRFLVFTGLLSRSVASIPARRMQELSSGGVIPETRSFAEVDE